MTEPRDHPFVAAIKPLVDAMGGELMDPALAQPDDVVLAWEGEDLLAVRLPQLSDSLDHILAALERGTAYRCPSSTGRPSRTPYGYSRRAALFPSGTAWRRSREPWGSAGSRCTTI